MRANQANTPLQNDQLREHNRLLVYHCLVRHADEKLTRVDINKSTNLSIPTVGTILREFQELGLVEQVGRSTARGGRPAQLVQFNAAAATVLAVDLAGSRFRAAIVDLLGKPLQRFEGPASGPQAADGLGGWLAGLLAEHGEEYKVAHLALSVPGVVEPRTGTVRLAPALGWGEYELAPRLGSELGLPITLENDVNALALAELHYGEGGDAANVAYLSITSGIGMGVVIDRQIFRGSNYAAGEIGYSTLGHLTGDTSTVALGEPGALEAHLFGIARAFEGQDGIDTEAGKEAREAFEHFCKDLLIILHNAVCLLNPERLVVSWPADTRGELCAYLEKSLKVPVPLEIAPATLGKDAGLLGVARLALDRLEMDLCRSQREPVA